MKYFYNDISFKTSLVHSFRFICWLRPEVTAHGTIKKVFFK